MAAKMMRTWAQSVGASGVTDFGAAMFLRPAGLTLAEENRRMPITETIGYAEGVPVTLTVTHQLSMVWLACGRWFKSTSRTERGQGYFEQRVARHRRLCTRCKQYARLARKR